MKLTCTEEMDPHGFEDLEGILPEKGEPANKEREEVPSQSEKENQNENGQGNQEEKEPGSSAPSEHICEVCGEEEASAKITADGRKQWICEGCLQERGLENEQEKEQEKREQTRDSDPSEHMCEECKESFGVEKPAVGKFPMNGRERWLCGACMQSAGYRRARRL